MNSINFPFALILGSNQNCKISREQESSQSKPSIDDTIQPSEDQLSDLSSDIVGYWKQLARKLNLPNKEVVRIQKDNLNYDEITEKCFNMLTTWLEKGPESTVKSLRDALMALGKNATALKHFPV